MNIFLFDIDGTLISTGGAGRAAMEFVLREFCSTIGDIQKVPMSGRTDRLIARDLFRLHEVVEEIDTWERFRDAYLRELPTHLERIPGKILPGIRELLDELSQRSTVALGLLTGNVREGARLKLSHFDLMRYFSPDDHTQNRAIGGFGDFLEHRNDVAHEALLSVRTKYGETITGDRIWVIGDTPLDIACGRAIGANVAAVATGEYSVEELEKESPDLLFEDLSAPERLLATIPE
jgi:phosphoglycolate phosphatase-like HAD superfamily hydrolase